MALRFPSMSLLKPITVPDPMERVRTLADARQAAQQEQIRGQQIQSTQRDQQAGAAIQQAFIQSGGELNEDTLRAIAQAAPHLYPQYKQVFDAQQTATTNRELQARKVAQENFEALEGQELPSATVQRATATPMAYPGQVGQGPSMEGRTDTLGATFQPQTIPGAPSLGQPGVQVTPQAAWQKLKETTDAEQRKLENEKQLYRERQKAEFEYNTTASGIPNLQNDTQLYQGKPTDVAVDPRSGRVFLRTANGLQDVTGQTSHYERPLSPSAQGKPGSYTPVFNARGEITGKFDSETGNIEPVKNEGYRRTALATERQKMEENAKSGLRVIKDLRVELAKPGMLAALAVPESPMARKARAARNEMVDVMTRLRTGAALNKDEQDFYRDQAPGLIDSLFSDPSTVEYKLSIFENEFKGLASADDAKAATHRFNPATGQIEEIKETK